MFWGTIHLQCCNYCPLRSNFSSKFQSSMTTFHHKLLTREGRVLANEWISSIIQDNICSLIHKCCHPKSYHSDIKYHMTLNTAFRVVFPCPTVTCWHLLVLLFIWRIFYKFLKNDRKFSQSIELQLVISKTPTGSPITSRQRGECKTDNTILDQRRLFWSFSLY